MTSATQTSPNFPLVIPTKTAAPTARLLVRNEAGQVVQQWLVKNTKCTLGSSTSCALRCTLPGVAPFHALLVIGARQTFVRALAPQVTRGGNAVTEVLLSGSQNHFELAGHRFELERNPTNKSHAPEEQQRLKFTLARPFSFQSREQKAKPQQSTPSIPNTIAEQSREDATESSQWVAKLVQSAIEPLECQIQNVLEPIAELRSQAEQQRELLRQYNEGTAVSPSEEQQHDVHLDLSEFLKASDENIDSRLQEFASEQSVVLEVLGERLADVTNQLGAIERIVQNEENQDKTSSPDIQSPASDHTAAIDELQDQVQQVAKSIQELESRQVSSSADDAEWRDEICHQVGTLRESLTGLAQQTGDSLREITRQTEESIGQLSDRTQDSIQALSQQAEQGLEDLRENNEENWNKLNSRTNSLFVKAEKLAAQTDALSSSTEQLSTQTGELTEQTSTLSNKTELLAEEAGQLSEKTAQLVSRTDTISVQTSDGFREVLERLDSPSTPSESEAQWRQGVQEQFTQLRETLNNLVSLPLSDASKNTSEATTREAENTFQQIATAAESDSVPQTSTASDPFGQETSHSFATPEAETSAAPTVEVEPTDAESVTEDSRAEVESPNELTSASEIEAATEFVAPSYEGAITEKEFSPGDTTVNIEELQNTTQDTSEETAETNATDLKLQTPKNEFADESVELDPDFTADSILSRAHDVETDMRDAADLDFFATTSGNAWESSEGIVEAEHTGAEAIPGSELSDATERFEENEGVEATPDSVSELTPESSEPESSSENSAANDNSWWQDNETEEDDFFGPGADTAESNLHDKDFFADSPTTTESWMEDAAPTELASDFQLDKPAALTTDAFETPSETKEDDEFFGLGSVATETDTNDSTADSFSSGDQDFDEQEATSDVETAGNVVAPTTEYTAGEPDQQSTELETEQDATSTVEAAETPESSEQPTAESGDLPSWWTSDTPGESFEEQGSDRIESFESAPEMDEPWTQPTFTPVDTNSIDAADANAAAFDSDHLSDSTPEQADAFDSNAGLDHANEISPTADSFSDHEPEQPIAPEPEEETLASSSTAASEASSLENSDEESIEDYMKQLLARMRGEPAVEAPIPSEDTRPKEPSLAALKQDLHDDGEDEITSAPEPPPERYTPRVLAPEKVQSLAAMRELANSSARTAIHKSSRQRNTRDVVLKGSISLIGFSVGMILLWLNGLAVNLVLVASVTSFAFSLIWGVDAATTLLPLLQLDTKSPSESSAADGEEQEELDSPAEAEMENQLAADE